MNRYINDHHYIVTGVASSRIRDATSDGVRQRPIRATRGRWLRVSQQTGSSEVQGLPSLTFGSRSKEDIRFACATRTAQRAWRTTQGCRSYLPHGSDLFHVAVPTALPLSTLPSSVPPRAAFNGSATLADQKPVKEVGGMPALPARR